MYVNNTIVHFYITFNEKLLNSQKKKKINKKHTHTIMQMFKINAFSTYFPPGGFNEAIIYLTVVKIQVVIF